MGGGRRSMFGSAPAKAKPAPPPAPMQQSSGGSFLGTMAQGFMFGTGSAVAHEAIHAGARAMSGGSGTTQQAAPAAGMEASQVGEACAYPQKTFLDCMTANNGDMGMCRYYFDALEQCKNGSTMQ